MIELKIQAVGTGLGVELPQEVLEQLETHEGESIFLENMLNGSYRLAKHNIDFVEQMHQIEDYMHEEDA